MKNSTPDLWNNNEIQFARLLCKLVVYWPELGIPAKITIQHVADSMDLTTDEVDSLFERAHIVWEESKRVHCPITVAERPRLSPNIHSSKRAGTPKTTRRKPSKESR